MEFVEAIKTGKLPAPGAAPLKKKSSLEKKNSLPQQQRAQPNLRKPKQTRKGEHSEQAARESEPEHESKTIVELPEGRIVRRSSQKLVAVQPDGDTVELTSDQTKLFLEQEEALRALKAKNPLIGEDIYEKLKREHESSELSTTVQQQSLKPDKSAYSAQAKKRPEEEDDILENPKEIANIIMKMTQCRRG